MEKFQHKLRTTQHTHSVEKIMTRSNPFFHIGKTHKIASSKTDNLTTYLRKFEIDRQNLNLAKRIMQCESQHSRNKYKDEWKKMKRFIRVRSNFKKTLYAQQPKIFKFQTIPGRGNLLVNIKFEFISSHLQSLNQKSFYMLKYSVGNMQLVPEKKLFTLQNSKYCESTFYAPFFLRKKSITCKLIKTVENELFQCGKFTIDFANEQLQEVGIIAKNGKQCGKAAFKIQLRHQKKNNLNGQQKENNSAFASNNESRIKQVNCLLEEAN